MAYIAPFGRDDFTECIHCGLCLEACPTYRLTYEEGLSPRGRIDLIHAFAETRLAPLDGNPRSLDLCLVCGSCAAACPSGVHYIDLVTKARSWLPEARSERRARRVLRYLRLFFLHPRLLRLGLGSVRFAARSGIAGFIVRNFFAREHREHFLDLIASITANGEPAAVGEPALYGAPTSGRGPHQQPALSSASVVNVFRGCVTPVIFPNVLDSLESLLARCGFEAAYPPGQACCGALLSHHGDIESARSLARRNIDAFETDAGGPIITEAAGCGAMLKGYAALLADDSEYAERAARFSARVRDASEFLAERAASFAADFGESGQHIDRIGGNHAAPAVAQSITIVYQDPCHLRHVQGVSEAPRRLLDLLPGLQRIDGAEEDLCCGSAGIYNLLEPDTAAILADRKIEALARNGVSLVVTANPGCRLQLAGRLRRAGIDMRHVIEVCAERWPH